MTFLPFATFEAADTRTAELWGNGRGPGWRDGDVTTRLYGIVTRPEDPEEPTDLPDGVDVALRVARHTVHLDRLMLEVALTVSEMAALVAFYDEWAIGVPYEIDDLARYGTQLYQCVQAHTSQSDWTPDVTPALWNAIVPEGVIGEWVQPTGGHDAYAKGALVTWKGWIWENTIDANVWEPGVYGWVKVEKL